MDVIKRAPVTVNPVIKNDAEIRESLSGSWKFRLDPDEKGLNEKWHDKPALFTGEVTVPGSWQGQGIGSDKEDLLWDFNIYARIYKATYTGTGWYGKAFRLSDKWRGKRIWLNFGGSFPTTEVWVNGIKTGSHRLPFVPFGFELTDLVKFGEENFIAVRISEADRIYGLSFTYCGNWSGLYRDVELTATGSCYMESFIVYPDADKRELTFKIKTGGHGGSPVSAEVTYGAIGVVKDGKNDFSEKNSLTMNIKDGLGCATVKVESPLFWSPDAPNLYRADVTLLSDGSAADAASDRFGFVSLKAENKHIKVNGEPYYIRGSGDFLSCPETGCPDWDRNRWRKRLATFRAYGYNQVRCQSYVYGPEYYDIADETGVIVQSEMGMIGPWGSSNVWHTYQWPVPTAANYDTLKEQWDAVVLRDVNHPSAIMYCMSNEFGSSGAGRRFKKTAWRCYNETKAVKPNSMVIWTDGGLDAEMPGDFVNEESGSDSQTDLPLIQHEFRWWSSLPNVALIERYEKECALHYYSGEIALKAASGHNTAHVLSQAVKNSQIVQYIEAKGKMEKVRRDTPRMAGISHFDAMDAISSPQGIFTEFYERKYASAEEWLRTNGDTVVLCSLGFNDRVYKSGDALAVKFFVSDFSHPRLECPHIEWELISDGEKYSSGKIDYSHEAYVTVEAGSVEIAVPETGRPVCATLRAAVTDGRRRFENEWPLWFYPANPGYAEGAAVYYKEEGTWLGRSGMPDANPDNLDGYKCLWTDRLDENLVSRIRAGGRAILAAAEGTTRGYGNVMGLADGRYFFTPPANYPPYEDGQNGTVLQNHPLFGDVPHRGFADLNFIRVMGDCPPIELEPLELNDWDPIFRAVHKYPCSHSIGYITECRIGKGGLVICSLDLNHDYPEAAYLAKCIGEYAASDKFDPENELGGAAVERLVTLTNI